MRNVAARAMPTRSEYLPDHIVEPRGGGQKGLFDGREHRRAQGDEYEGRADPLEDLGDEYVPVPRVEGEERELVK